MTTVIWWMIEYDSGTDEPIMQRVMDEFYKAHRAAGSPPDAALFGRSLPDPETKMMRLYLSPGSITFAGPIIQKYNAKPSSKPPRDSGLLMGAQSAFTLLK